MELLNALILGIVQGLTEFLPVSSSGHIELAKAILNYEVQEDVRFTVILHFATVLSTLVVFRKDIVELLQGIMRWQWNDEMRFAVAILVSILPVGAVYVLFKDDLDLLFEGNLLLVGAMLWITALLLGLTKLVEKKTSQDKPVGIGQAVVIGLAQAVAVMPGISRSGSTIATALLLGVDKAKAARFSFLMVLPPIIGATLLELKDALEAPASASTQSEWLAMSVGFIGAFLAGWWACNFMIRLVRRGQLIYFALYCAVVGSLAMAYSLA